MLPKKATDAWLRKQAVLRFGALMIERHNVPPMTRRQPWWQRLVRWVRRLFQQDASVFRARAGEPLCAGDIVTIGSDGRARRCTASDLPHGIATTDCTKEEDHE
jgi:hypothetical protein